MTAPTVPPDVSAPGARVPISGVVICLDEEDTIARCLESLAFCDDIVVVDSGSTDRTREIARRYTSRVVEQSFLGYREQKNFALDLAKYDWVVCLDADEALNDELSGQIQERIAADDGRVSGFRLDRITYFLGIWHNRGEWCPDRPLRVFRRERGRWGGRDTHEYVRLEGPIDDLPGRLLHWNYRDLAEHIQKIDRFSERIARELHEEGRRFRLRDLVFRPPLRFLKGFVLRQGFRQGVPGFLVSASTAYYVLMKYAKLWELERTRRG